jgi:hypothetical protein
LRQVFIRVYRLEKQSVMLKFSNQLWQLLPLSPSLWFNSPLPYLSFLCVWGSGPQTVKHLPQSPFTDKFFR